MNIFIEINIFMQLFVWILIQITISILIVWAGHHVWNYIKDTYSTKKTKDLVNVQVQKYKKMMQELQETAHKHETQYIEDSEKDLLDQRLTDFILESGSKI